MLSHLLGILQQETTLQRTQERRWHTRKYDAECCWWGAQTRLHTEAFTHRSHRSFYTNRSFCTEKSLAALRHRSFYREKSLHRGTFTHRSVYTEKSWHKGRDFAQKGAYTQKLLQTNAATHRSLHTEGFNTQVRLHTETFTHRNRYTESFYTEKLSREVFTQRALTRGSFHTQQFFHREIFTQAEAFTHRRIYTQKFLRSAAGWRAVTLLCTDVATSAALPLSPFFRAACCIAFGSKAEYEVLVPELLWLIRFTGGVSHSASAACITQIFTQRSFYTQKLLDREVFTQRCFYTKWKVEIGSNSLGNTLRRCLREQAFPTCSKKKPQITTKFQFHDSMNMFKKE